MAERSQRYFSFGLLYCLMLTLSSPILGFAVGAHHGPLAVQVLTKQAP